MRAATFLARMPHRAFWVLALILGRAEAQSLLDTAIPFGGEPVVARVPFSVTANASGVLTIVDPGVPGGLPPPLARLYVAVIRGSELVASSSTTGTRNVDLTPGDYELHLVGVPDGTARVGSVAVTIRESAGGPVIVDAVRAFELPEPSVASPAAFEHTVSVSTPGSYEVEITDLAHPTALGSITTLVVPVGGMPVGPPFVGTGVIPFNANAGNYDIFVFAELAASQSRGLAGVRFRPAGGAASFSAIDEIGDWPYRYAFDIASPTVLSTTFADLGFPQPLAGFNAVLAGNGAFLGRSTGTGSFTATALPGPHALYVDARPVGPSLPGSFGLIVSDSAQTRLIESVQAVTDAGGPFTGVRDVGTSFEIAAPGNYTLTLTDFGLSGFFDPFDSVTLALTRNQGVVAMLTAPGTLSFAAAAGSYSLVIVADAAGTNGSGLLGILVRGGPSNAIVYDRTAAVGANFHSQQVAVSSAVSLDVTATDLAFPGRFADVKVAVTRGAVREGEILGGGTFSIDAMPGNYFVNTLARPNAATGYSTLGLEVQVSPAAPVVALSSSASSVVVGGSVTLTWATTDATSCSASGGWTGSRPASGSVAVGPLSNVSTFTLTCTGPGGTGAATLRVEITPEQRSGGGGAFGLLCSIALLVCRLAVRTRATRVPV